MPENRQSDVSSTEIPAEKPAGALARMTHAYPGGVSMTHFKTVAALIVVLGTTAPLAAARDSQSATVAAQGSQSATAAAQDSQSATAASTLTALLDQRKLEAIAARDPDQPGRFVAALYFPGSQLLVVSGPYPVPAVLEKRIAEANYRDVYLDILGTVGHEGQFFVMDLQADGLRRVCDRDQPFDSTSRNDANQVSFDGNWAAQKLSESEYNARFGEDDARYARMLGVLAGAFTQSKTSPPTVRKGGN